MSPRTMRRQGPLALTLVKRMAENRARGLPRRPVALVGACLLALLALNVAAFVHGGQAPWLLGGVLLADMTAVATGILVASRQALRAEETVEASAARLSAIVDSAMDAIITVDQSQKIVLFNRAAENVFRV